jgi:hypothetical protein
VASRIYGCGCVAVEGAGGGVTAGAGVGVAAGGTEACTGGGGVVCAGEGVAIGAVAGAVVFIEGCAAVSGDDGVATLALTSAAEPVAARALWLRRSVLRAA